MVGPTHPASAARLRRYPDLKRQAPQAVCDVFPANLPRTLLVNRTTPPFDNPELRRAMSTPRFR
jgi:hypothetical protein